MRTILALLVAGCTPMGEPVDATRGTLPGAAPELAPPPTETLEHSQLAAGGTGWAWVDGLTEGDQVTFAASATAGPGPCPPALLGLCLDIVAPTVIGTAFADYTGHAIVSVPVPAGTPPMTTVYLQAAILGAAGPATTQVAAAIVDDDADLDGYVAGVDCNDADATVHPGASERFGDAVDSDCDGQVDGTPFGFQDYRWSTPRAPRVVETAGHWIIVTTADWFQDNSGGAAPTDVGVGMAIDQLGADNPAPTINAPVRWQGANNPQPLHAAVDAASTGGAYWAGTTYVNNANNWHYSVMRKVEWDFASSHFIMRTLEYSGMPYNTWSTDADVIVDPLAPDRPWMVACGPEHLQVLRGGSGIPSPSDDMFDAITPLDTETCFATALPAADQLEITTCGSTGCTGYLFDASTTTLTGSSLGYAPAWAALPTGPIDGDYRGGSHVVTDGADGAWVIGPTGSWHVLAGRALASVDAWSYAGQLFVSAVPAGPPGSDVLLAYGAPGALTERVVTFSDPSRPGLTAQATSIHADAAGILVAVTGTSALANEDAVGWMVLRP